MMQSEPHAKLRRSAMPSTAKRGLMTRVTPFGGILALTLAAAPLTAQTLQEAAATATELLAFDGPPTATGLERLAFDLASDCTFEIEVTGEQGGVPAQGVFRGNLNIIDRSNVNLTGTGPDISLQFDPGSEVVGWETRISIPDGNPLYDTLSDTPDAMFPFTAICDADGCELSMEFGPDATNRSMRIYVADILSDDQSQQLLEAFQTMADLCTQELQ